MQFSPLLLRPRILSMKNTWWHSSSTGKSRIRDLLMIGFSVAIMAGIYHACRTIISNLGSQLSIAYLPPSLPLSLGLSMFLLMLLFSNSISALGTLFLGRDLPLILSSPIRGFRFFFGKLLDILGTSTWMTIVFAFPLLIALGRTYDAPITFYLYSFLILLPFFIIPSSFAIIAITLFSSWASVKRVRAACIIIAIAVAIGLIIFTNILSPEKSPLTNSKEILNLFTLLSIPTANWMPSYWAAASIGEFLEQRGKPVLPYVTMLYSLALILASFAFLCVRSLHYYAFSKAQSTKRTMRLQSKAAQLRFKRLTPFLDSRARALLTKELRTFSRDLTHTVQLILLLGLCMLYLYNFKVLQAVQGLPEVARHWWQATLVLANLSMGAFIITAITARFVFPTISLEGQSFWVLKTAPISTYEFLRVKFWLWLIPIATISSVIFASGGLAINAEEHIIIISALTSWIVCYGIVGLGIGFGSFFSNFDWENPSQLATSLGSLVFMLASTMLILANMIPAGALIILRTIRNLGYEFTVWEWYLSVSGCAFLLAYINYATTKWALELGMNKLNSYK